MRSFRTLALSTLVVGIAFGCSTGGDPERPGVFSSSSQGGAGGDNGDGNGSAVPVIECERPPVVDTSRTCGSETINLFEQKPTIYFLLDVSGSMAGSVLSGDEKKLDAAKEAIVDVAEEIGHRVKYGLTVFPGADEEFDLDSDDTSSMLLFGCAAGDEVFAIQEGDPIACLNRSPNGPVLREFRKTVAKLKASGGTPLSPTLEALIPTLVGQEGKTAVVLLTDGSPNCNPEAVCNAKDCEVNRAGFSLNITKDEWLACDEDFNCCDPELVGEYIDSPSAGCVDIDQSEAALQFLQDAGVDTYVIGVVGGTDFDSDMNRLAIAGGKARKGELAYFDVENLEELADTVRVIGSELSRSCTIELGDRPPQANELNVYFDGEIVLADEEEGWTLDGTTVSVHGEPCETLQNGEVTEVQLVSGCRTVIK